MRDCHLYLISPPILAPAIFASVLEQSLTAGPVAAFQLRLKNQPKDVVIKAVKMLMPVCHAYDTAFILNDDPAMALRLGCDGAHIGNDDGDPRAARDILKDKTLGVSCYDSLHRAMAAGEAGADYVAFGSFYPTATKAGATPARLETLEAWAFSSPIPAVAIGGVTPANAAPLVRAGAHFLAVSAGVWGYTPSPAHAVRAFHQVIGSS